MPKMSGIEVLENLKNRPDFGLPVIIGSASQQPADIRRCPELQANAYLLKSVDFEEYTAALALTDQFWAHLNVLLPEKRVSLAYRY